MALITSRSGSILHATDKNKNQEEFEAKDVTTVFLTIGNKKTTPISIVDYKLILKFKDGDEDIRNPYFVKNAVMHFEFENFVITLRDNSQNLLLKKKLIVTPDNPVTGFVVFDVGRKLASSDELASISVILYDSYGSEYRIETKSEDLSPPSILPRLIEGFEIKPIPEH